jgi:hypothetical protein
MSEARDDMLSTLLICIQEAPDESRLKLFGAIKAFAAEHVERKTSLSRFMSHLIAPAPADEKEAAAKPARAKPARVKAVRTKAAAKK